jgi:hypothetical protein
MSATNLLRIANIRKMDVAGTKGQQLFCCCCCAYQQHKIPALIAALIEPAFISCDPLLLQHSKQHLYQLYFID